MANDINDTKKNGGKNPRTKKILSPRSTVRTLALKFYAEQVPGWQNGQHGLQAPIMCGNVSANAAQANHANAMLAKDVIEDNILKMDKTEIQVICILHDKDTMVDEKDFWDPPTEKPHFHIIVRVLGKAPLRVSTILNWLGIVYRKGVDDKLWIEHGVETVGNFASYAMYLTHETKQAELDGKYPYDFNELISNLTPDELRDVRKGYIDPSRVKVKVEDMAKLDETAYDMGYNLKDFSKWYGSLPFEVRCNMKMRTVERSYNRGVDDRVMLGETVTRLCVYISGAHNTGKTYAATHTFTDHGQRALSVEGGGTGKFDLLQPYHDAIIINDDVCPNLLNMSDNKICRAYRRNKDNPAWAGHYLIVTSNWTFDEFLDRCHLGNEENRNAAKSRFYVCHLEKIDGARRLVLDEASKRGSDARQRERLQMFRDFQDKFNEIIRTYVPEVCDIDYDQEEEGRRLAAFRQKCDIIHEAYYEMLYCLVSHRSDDIITINHGVVPYMPADDPFTGKRYTKDFQTDPFIRRLNEECKANPLMDREGVLNSLHEMEFEYQALLTC